GRGEREGGEGGGERGPRARGGGGAGAVSPGQVGERAGEFTDAPGAQRVVDPPEEGVRGQPARDGAVAQDPDHVLTVLIRRAERRRQGIRRWCARCHHEPKILRLRSAAPELDPGRPSTVPAVAGPKVTR